MDMNSNDEGYNDKPFRARSFQSELIDDQNRMAGYDKMDATQIKKGITQQKDKTPKKQKM